MRRRGSWEFFIGLIFTLLVFFILDYAVPQMSILVRLGIVLGLLFIADLLYMVILSYLRD